MAAAAAAAIGGGGVWTAVTAAAALLICERVVSAAAAAAAAGDDEDGGMMLKDGDAMLDGYRTDGGTNMRECRWHLLQKKLETFRMVSFLKKIQAHMLEKLQDRF